MTILFRGLASFAFLASIVALAVQGGAPYTPAVAQSARPLLRHRVTYRKNSSGLGIKYLTSYLTSHQQRLSANPWLWAPDTTVNVFVTAGQFSGAEKEVLRIAIMNWDSIARELGTGVTFSYAGETASLEIVAGRLTLTRTDLNRTHPGVIALFQPLQLLHEELITSAAIYFDWKIQKPQVFASYMAHEMGHGFGLSDCPRCRNTVMRFFPGPNEGNGFSEATDSDKALIKIRYSTMRTAQLTRPLDTY